MTPHARVEFWIWVLMYLGLGLVGFGVAVHRADAALGWAVAMAGGAISATGVALIWLRSRMKDHP